MPAAVGSIIVTPLLRALTLGAIISVIAVPLLPEQVLAGKMERAQKCLKKGDSKVSKSIAGSTVKHAMKKWNLEELGLDDQAKKVAKKEVYEFLKWKLGSPTAICGQYVTAGQKHFNKAYGDEAAAALLGMTLPGDGKAEVVLPEKFTEQLKQQVDAQGDNAAKAIQDEYGIPPELSNIIISKLKGVANKQIERFGFNWPKGWDVDNRLVAGMIAAQRAGGAMNTLPSSGR